MRRILLYIFVYLAVYGLVVCVGTWAWYMLGEGQGAAEAWHSFATATTLTPAVLCALTATYTALLLYIYISRQWCPRPWLAPEHVVPVIYLLTAWAALATLLPSLALQELLPPLPDAAREQTMTLLSSPYGYIMIGLLAPVLEEVVFRGAVLKALVDRTQRPALAIVLSALIFALLHFNPAQMPHAFLVGLLLGWLCLRTGSIVPGILFHWLNNTTAYALARLAPQCNDQSLGEVFGSSALAVGAVALSAACLIAAVIILQRRTRATTIGHRHHIDPQK